MRCPWCKINTSKGCSESEHSACSSYRDRVRNRPKPQSSSSTETPLSSQESTIGSPGSTLQSLEAFALQNVSLLSEQRSVLQNSYPLMHELNELAVAAVYIQKAILNAITAAYARDCLSKKKIGPQSPSEKASQSPMNAEWGPVHRGGSGAEKRQGSYECPICKEWFGPFELTLHRCKDHSVPLTIKDPDKELRLTP